MAKYELLTVLKSMELMLDKGTKEDVAELVRELIRAAEGDIKGSKK